MATAMRKGWVVFAFAVLLGGCSAVTDPVNGVDDWTNASRWFNPVTGNLDACSDSGVSFSEDNTRRGDCVYVKPTTDARQADYRAWVTETRIARNSCSVALCPYGLGVPIGEMPAPITFLTQTACEAFRSAHPSYTKPEEVCRQVFLKRWKRPENFSEWWGKK